MHGFVQTPPTLEASSTPGAPDCQAQPLQLFIALLLTEVMACGCSWGIRGDTITCGLELNGESEKS